jgi:hypothetical protein
MWFRVFKIGHFKKIDMEPDINCLKDFIKNVIPVPPAYWKRSVLLSTRPFTAEAIT